MIRWVWEHCREVKEFDAVYVATDSEKSKRPPSRSELK